MYTVVPDKTTGDIFTEAMWDTYVRDNLNTGCPVMVAISTLVGTAASITFSSIPTTFNSLHLTGYFRSDNAATSATMFLRFNGDTGSNYDYQVVQGNAAVASASEGLAQTQIGIGHSVGNTGGANLFSGISTAIQGYASSANNKALTSKSSYKGGTSSGSLTVTIWSGFWRSNAPVTSLTVFPSAGNLVSGSRLVLYGVP